MNRSELSELEAIAKNEEGKFYGESDRGRLIAEIKRLQTELGAANRCKVVKYGVDRIKGVPEGYRLGERLNWKTNGNGTEEVTFELVPDEKPKEDRSELTRTKKALEMAMDGLRVIGNIAMTHGGSDWDVVRSLSSETRAFIRKELGE